MSGIIYERGRFRVVDTGRGLWRLEAHVEKESNEKGPAWAWRLVSMSPPFSFPGILTVIQEDFQDVVAETLGELKEREEKRAQANGTLEDDARAQRSTHQGMSGY